MAWAEIGRRVARHPTTIRREVLANKGRHHYRPAVAERRAQQCLRRPRTAVLAEAGPVRDRVTTELKLGRSPEAIWADLTAEDVAGLVCVETIYTALYAGVLDVTARDCLRMRRPRRRSRQARHPNQRPALPPRHRPRQHHPRPRQPRRLHHQRPTPTQPRLPITHHALHCPHRAVITETGPPVHQTGGFPHLLVEGSISPSVWPTAAEGRFDGASGRPLPSDVMPRTGIGTTSLGLLGHLNPCRVDKNG